MTRLLISAGELSGEHHAGRLLGELRALKPDLQIDAFGGAHLEAAGARLLFPLSDFAVMGFGAVLRMLSRFIDILRRFDDYLERERPDAVILVDYPGLHVRFAALAKRRGIPVIYFVCPQLWAWAPWRARRFARVVDCALTILPFEQEYYRRRGIDAFYVGHPAAERLRADAPSDRDLAAQVRAAKVAIALMPGSRPQEARANLPLMLAVARRLAAEVEGVEFLLPQLRADTRAVCAAMLGDPTLPPVRLVEAVSPVLEGARFALVASGTATFEVACRGVPMVVVYRITRVQRLLGSLLLTVPWISQVNLIAGREVVPEFVTALQSHEPVEAIAKASLALVVDGPARAACVDALTREFASAFAPGASRRAAAAVARQLGWDRVPSAANSP